MERYIAWFMNVFIGRFCGRMRRPTYFDIDKTCPQLHELTRSYPLIRAEFEGVLARGGRLPAYHELDPQYGNAEPPQGGGDAGPSGELSPNEMSGSRTAVAERNWNVFMLYLLGHKPERNRAMCPETCRLLDRIPNLMQAFFSIIDPHRSIAVHVGPYLGYIRYHLGLRVPTDDPPMLIVNSQPYVWKEGEAVVFDDSWPHEVINHSGELRAVLIVDVLRPLPAWPHLLNRVVLFGFAARTYGRAVMRRLERSEAVVPLGGG